LKFGGVLNQEKIHQKKNRVEDEKDQHNAFAFFAISDFPQKKEVECNDEAVIDIRQNNVIDMTRSGVVCRNIKK
jgi:hypothetical protein